MRESMRVDSAKAKQWGAVLERWRASGRSLRSFALSSGVSEPGLRYWQRRLAPPPPAGRAARRPGSGNSGGPLHPQSMIPVKIVAVEEARVSLKAGAEPCIELHLVSGVEVRVPSGFSAEDLRRLLEVLR